MIDFQVFAAVWLARPDETATHTSGVLPTRDVTRRPSPFSSRSDWGVPTEPRRTR